MEFDTTLSLELVVSVLAVLAAVWRLEGKFDRQISALSQGLKEDIADVDTELKSVRTELKADIAGLRTELKADIAELRQEFKGDNAALRQEFKADNAALRQELKGDMSALRTEIRRVEAKVDDGNQRLARLEGIILAREDMVDNIVESSQ